jgi:replicative superfamily II helicase
MSIYESNKKSDNDALNEILDNVESINKKVGVILLFSHTRNNTLHN